MAPQLAPARSHTDEVKDQVIALYKEGHKLAEITRRTRVPRATIYYILQREGIRPDRTKTEDSATVTELLDRLQQQERLIGRLEAKLERTQHQLDMVLAQQGVTPKPATRRRAS